MATELFSLWGFKTGWLSQRGDKYDVTAEFGDGEDLYFRHDSPEFCELVSACNAVWPQIGNMRGDIVWTGSGRLCRAKKNSADVSPIAGVARKHADYFARWERSLPQFAETSAHSRRAPSPW